jgi:hypothetical protein
LAAERFKGHNMFDGAAISTVCLDGQKRVSNERRWCGRRPEARPKSLGENDPHSCQSEVPMSKKPVYLSLSSGSNDTEIRRNYLCPEYEECLDYTALFDLDLDCNNCLMKDQKHLDAVFPQGDLPGFRLILECVFNGECGKSA